MSLIDRLVYWLNTTNAPRYCPECGQPIKVERADRFDEKTGANVGQWYWVCSDYAHISVSVHGDVISVERRGGQQHVWGRGLPRWFVSPPQ